MVPAITRRRGRKMARDSMTSFAFETVSSFMQATVMLLAFAVLVWENGVKKIGYGRRKGILLPTGRILLVCDVKLASVLSF